LLWQQLANGATMGMIYALITLGLTMVYGVLRILHISHAVSFALGGYICGGCIARESESCLGGRSSDARMRDNRRIDARMALQTPPR